MIPRVFNFSDYRLETVRTMPEKLYCGDNKTTSIQCELGSSPEDPRHTFRRVKHSCHRPVCNVCGDDVLKARTFDIYRRLEAGRKEFARQGVALGEYVELILSPPSTEYGKYKTLDGFRHMYRTSNEFARSIGFAGGTSAFHPVRGENAIIDSWMHGETELEFSPHYHYVGFMPNRHLINSDVFYANTGWVYKVVPRRRWGKGLWAKINYELDHAAVLVLDQVREIHGHEEAITRHMPVNRWHGIVAYNNLKHEELEVEELCKCGHHLQLVREGLVMADRVVKIEHKYHLAQEAFNRAVVRYKLFVVPVTLAGIV